MSPTAILNPRIPNFTPPFPSSSSLHKLSQLHFLNLPLTFPQKTFQSQIPPHSLHFQSYQLQFPIEDEEEEEHVIGDCLVFEEGVFEDPCIIQKSENRPQTQNNKKKTEIQSENLIPEEWVEVQREINITKKERRKLAQQLEFGQRVEKKRLGLRPIGENGNVSGNSIEEFLKAREEKLKQLKPLILEKPDFSEVNKRDKNNPELSESEEESSISRVSSERVMPRNPRSAVYGGGLEDITEFFNSGIYEVNAAKTSEGMVIFMTRFKY